MRTTEIQGRWRREKIKPARKCQGNEYIFSITLFEFSCFPWSFLGSFPKLVHVACLDRWNIRVEYIGIYGKCVCERCIHLKHCLSNCLPTGSPRNRLPSAIRKGISGGKIVCHSSFFIWDNSNNCTTLSWYCFSLRRRDEKKRQKHT